MEMGLSELGGVTGVRGNEVSESSEDWLVLVLWYFS